MLKRIPYEQYQVAAVEQWLNDRAAQGYALVGLVGPYARLQQTDSPEVYRVRYLPDGPSEDGLLNWGSLYIYRAQRPDDLPAATHAADSLLASEKVATPGVMDVIIFVLSMVIMWYMVYRVFMDHYFLAAIGAAVAFIGIMVNTTQWRRKAREMVVACGQAEARPNTKTTIFGNVCILTFVVLLAAQFVVNKL